MLILPNTSERARRLVTEAGQHAGRGIPLGAVDSCRPPFVQGRPGQQAPASPQFLSSSRETPEPEVVFLLSSRHPHFQPASPPPTSYTLFQGHLLDFSVICNLFASKSRGAQPPAAPACWPVAATVTLLGPSGPWFPQASPGLISCSVIGSEPTVHRFKLSLANSHFRVCSTSTHSKKYISFTYDRGLVCIWTYTYHIHICISLSQFSSNHSYLKNLSLDISSYKYSPFSLFIFTELLQELSV